MPSNEFLLKDAQGLELEIERHCAGLGLDCKDESQVSQFVHELLQNMKQHKVAAIKGDRAARQGRVVRDGVDAARCEQQGIRSGIHNEHRGAWGAGIVLGCACQGDVE